MGDGRTRGSLFAVPASELTRLPALGDHLLALEPPALHRSSRGGIEPSQSGTRSRRSGNN